jgi:integrase
LQEYRKNWVPNDQGFLFANKKGSSIGGEYVCRKIVHPIRERLGIPRGAFHAFRHDHATTMFSEGCPNPNDVKDNMGHADIRTMRYTHAIPNDRREAVNRATLAHLRHSAAFLESKLLQTN